MVHRLRKQRDHDPLNMRSGTIGIIGAADEVFVMERKEQTQNTALMICTGRDVEYREMERCTRRSDDGVSRATGCPPATPPAPEGKNRVEARTHFRQFPNF